MYVSYLPTKRSNEKICSPIMYKTTQSTAWQYLKECPFYSELAVDYTDLDKEEKLNGKGLEVYDWIILCWSVSYHNIIDG